jgi:GDP-L-fucose synthase
MPSDVAPTRAEAQPNRPGGSGEPSAAVYPLSGKRIWVAGHAGMVGSALVRRLSGEGCEIIKVSRGELDLRRQSDVEAWMTRARPDGVFLAAATVGGIHANVIRPAEFLYDNLVIQSNIIEAARRTEVTKLLFLGSACIYPRLAAQPMREEALLTGPLEPTNEAYAVAKIAGIKLCESYRRQHGCDFISAMPNNVYGPGDNFDPDSGHVIGALIHKMFRAKFEGVRKVEVWGSGTPRREFLFVDDLADALVFLMKHYSDASHVNIGSGKDISIGELVTLIAAAVGYDGAFSYDRTRPDGVPQKLLDCGRLDRMGWVAKTSLEDGLRTTCEWYKVHCLPA